MVQQENMQEQPAMTTPAPEMTEPAGKSKTWIYITIGVVILLIILYFLFF